MARQLQRLLSLLCFSALLIMTNPPLTAAAAGRRLLFAETTTPTKGETLTHLHFYFHDVVSGPDPTAVRVAAAESTNSSATGFGAMVVVDDLLTVGPDLRSKSVGRAQGFYGVASKTESALALVVNYVFTEGKYNGSSLSVMGRNAVFDDVREMPVVGGTGVFRLARGYALAKTYTFNVTSGDAVVEYDVYVFH